MEKRNLKEIKYDIEEFVEKLGLTGELESVLVIYPLFDEDNLSDDKPIGIKVLMSEEKIEEKVIEDKDAN